MTRIIAKICIRRKCTSQTIREFFVKPAKRAFSCATKVAFVSRASDADRRSRRCGDAARRSLLPKRQRSVRGLLTRPSSNGVDASAKAALAARQMRRGSWSRVSACAFSRVEHVEHVERFWKQLGQLVKTTSFTPRNSALASLGVFASPRVANPRKGRLRAAIQVRREVLRRDEGARAC